MACFIVTAAEAVVVTVAEKKAAKNEAKIVKTDETVKTEEVKVPLSRKLKWLTYMLWGGVILLAFEHVWHGEVVPWFPFLTAMSDPADAAEMFTEMATVGVCMALLITGVWFAMCKAADSIVRRSAEKKANEQAG